MREYLCLDTTVRRVWWSHCLTMLLGFTLDAPAAASPWYRSAAHMGPRGIGVVTCSENSATLETGAAWTAGLGGAAVSEVGVGAPARDLTHVPPRRGLWGR